MKKLIALLFLLPLLSFASTVDVVYQFSDYTTHPLNVRRVQITPLGPSADYSGAFLSRRPIVYNASTFYTLTNGYFTATNLITGYAYQVAFSDGYGEPMVTNYFGTNLSGTVSAVTNKTTYIQWQAGVAIQLFGPYFNTTNVIVNLSTNGGSGSGVTNNQFLTGTPVSTNGNFAGTFTGDLIGNAATATTATNSLYPYYTTNKESGLGLVYAV